MSLIFILFKNEIRNQIPNKLSFLFYIFGIATNLFIYKMMAESFGKELFEYIVIGEFLISFSLSMADSPLKLLRSLFIESIFEQILQIKNLYPVILKMSLSHFFKSILMSFTTIAIGIAFFNLRIDVQALSKAFFLILVTLPFFASLGMIGVSLVLFLGRGFSFLNQLMFLATVTAGTYFPLQTLDSHLQEILIYANPFAYYLENLRKILKGINVPYTEYLFYFGGITIFLIPLSYFLFLTAERNYRRKNKHISSY